MGPIFRLLEAGRLTLIIRQQESSSIATQNGTRKLGNMGSREGKQDGRGRTKTGPDRGSDGGSFLSFSRSFLLQDELGATIATSEENASKETQ